MSTNIRVNVGNPQWLIDLNRRQQKANREAFVIRDEARRASDKAFDQLERERKAAGLDPATGRPIASARIASGFPRIDQEPAANRFGENTAISHCWLFSSATNLTFSTGLIGAGFDNNLLSRLSLVTSPISETRNLLIGSGDGSSWATIQEGSLTPAPDLPAGDLSFPPYPETTTKTYSNSPRPFLGFSFIILPTGKGNFILTFINWYYWNFLQVTGTFRREQFGTDYVVILARDGGYLGSSFSSFGEVTYSSFAVNNQTIRAIETPELFREKLAIIGPRITTTAQTLGVYPYDFVSYLQETFLYKGITNTSNFAIFEDSSFETRLENYSITSVYSPLVYAKINQAAFFSENILSAKPTYKGLLADARRGIYKKIQEDDDLKPEQLYVPGDTFDYAQWPIPNVAPSLTAWDEGYTGAPPKPLPTKSLTLVAQNPPGYTIPELDEERSAIFVVTDWGQPGYCQSRALELGFSLSDLSAESSP